VEFFRDNTGKFINHSVLILEFTEDLAIQEVSCHEQF